MLNNNIAISNKKRSFVPEKAIYDISLVDKGNITVNTDFPYSNEVEVGWSYSIKAAVTDDASGRTATGQSFDTPQFIHWVGDSWELIGGTATSGTLDHTQLINKNSQ
jgi:hypothetical protein